MLVKKHLETENQNFEQRQSRKERGHTNQKPRDFGSDGGGISYKEGFRLPPERGSSDLRPAIEYKSAQNVDKKSFEKFFIERVAKFVCGCINQRCNGTIYFGVGDNKVKANKILL
jgi:hypothetical protein